MSEIVTRERVERAVSVAVELLERGAPQVVNPFTGDAAELFDELLSQAVAPKEPEKRG